MACRILVLWLGIEPGPWQWKPRILNHWATGELPQRQFLMTVFPLVYALYFLVSVSPDFDVITATLAGNKSSRVTPWEVSPSSGSQAWWCPVLLPLLCEDSCWGEVTGPPRQNCRRSPWVPSELPLFFLNKHSQCPWSVPKVLKFLLVFWLSRERLSGLFSPPLWMPLHLCFSRLWAELRTRGATRCVYFVSGLGSAQCLWNAPLLQRAVWFPVSSLQTFCFRNLPRLLYPSHRRCLTFASFLLLWVTTLSICAHISAHGACTAVWVLRPWTVSLPEINMLGINPAPQNMTLFGEKFFPEIIKLRWGLWGGPSSKVTGVLMKRGSLEPGRRAQRDHSECPALCDPLVCSRPGSPVHGTLQAGIPEWVAIAPSRGSSRPKGWTPVRCVSCIGRRVLHHLGSPCREGRPRGKLATHQGVQTPGLQDWVVTHLCCLSHEDWGAVRAALGRRTECVPWGGNWGLSH